MAKKSVVILLLLIFNVVVLVYLVCVFATMQGMAIRPAAEAVVDRFYGDYNLQNFKSIYDKLTVRAFRQTSSYQDLEQILLRNRSVMGSYRSRKPGAWRIAYSFHGLVFTIQYETSYEQGNATETFVLMKEKDRWGLSIYKMKPPWPVPFSTVEDSLNNFLKGRNFSEGTAEWRWLKGDCFWAMAETFYELGNWNEAIKYYEQAILQDPENWRYYKDLGYLYRRMNKYDLAVQEYQRSLAHDPNNPETLNLLGVAYRSEGKWRKRRNITGNLYLFSQITLWLIAVLERR